MSDSLTYANVEGWWTFDEDGDFTSGTANDKTSNNIDLTLKYFDSDGNNLTSNSGQSTYIAPIGRAIGEGFTVSITKNLKDDGTWVTTQDQTTRLVISFNGIPEVLELTKELFFLYFSIFIKISLLILSSSITASHIQS